MAILINTRSQLFTKAAALAIEFNHFIFLDTGHSCARPKLFPPVCWLSEVSGQREITFKGLRTYYRAVSGVAGGR